MSFEITITIPIKPHLKKMIARTKKVDPFTISMGKCFYSGIIYQPLLKHSIRVKAKDTKKFTEQLPIVIPSDLAKENRFTWDARTLAFIDSALSGIFEDKLFMYLDDNCFEKGDIQTYINRFMDNYDITEDDIQYETLKKMYYRKRKSANLKDDVNFRAKQKKQQPTIIQPQQGLDLFSQVL